MKVPRSSRPEIPLRDVGTEWGQREPDRLAPDVRGPTCSDCGMPFTQSASGELYCSRCGTVSPADSVVRAGISRARRYTWWPGALLALFCSMSVLCVTFITATSVATAGQVSVLVFASILIGVGALIGFAASYDRWFLVPVAIEFMVVLFAAFLLLVTFDVCSALSIVLGGQSLLIIYAVGVFLGFLLQRLLRSFK